MELQNSLRDSL